MTPPAELAIARKAYDARAWRDAREAYRAGRVSGRS